MLFSSTVCRTRLAGLILVALALFCSSARATTLEQVISREDPRFDAATAQLVAGRDGLIYVSRPTSGSGYTLRMKPDGSERFGIATGHMQVVNAVNANGIRADRIAHFAHTAGIFDANQKQIASYTDLNNENYDAPQAIACGASGDFYVLDHYAHRITQLTPSGAIVKVYPIPPAPGRNYGKLFVSESKKVFVVESWGYLVVVNFDGTLRKQLAALSLYSTMDDDGTIYYIPNTGDSYTTTDLDGNRLKTVNLQVGDHRPTAAYPMQGVQLLGSQILLKHAHPNELFARYDLATGAFLGVVETRHETLTVTYPDGAWTAGATQPFNIALTGTQRTIPPDWKVSMAPFGTAFWHEAARQKDTLAVPAQAGGLYNLKITPGAGGSEYTLNDTIEVRRAGSRGTITTMTPGSRLYYGAGEAMPVHVVTRCKDSDLPAALRLELFDGETPVPHEAPLLSIAMNVAHDSSYTIPGALTQRLRPGVYRLATSAPGFTTSQQYLVMGPGAAAESPFKVMQYGDYQSPIYPGEIFDGADVTTDQLAISRRLGVNFYVSRQDQFATTWYNTALGGPYLGTLKQRLSTDPNGVAPDKADLLFPNGQTAAGLGAAGSGILSILKMMDSGLPVGTGPYGLKPEQDDAAIRNFTKPMMPLPAYKGWTWAANWWDDPAQVKMTPDQTTAYAAALKKAKDTGAWDPILNTVGDTDIGWQVEAQDRYGKVLKSVAPDMQTVGPGPYRRPYIYPPVTYANVNQIDMHFQAEQITTPFWSAHAGAYYRRPGKPSWMHPELFNDPGTGDQILPLLWNGFIGGVDGTGTSGNVPTWGVQPLDWRTGYAGSTSVFRSIFATAGEYGPWLMKLPADSPVAIPVSRRQIKLDNWGGIGGQYFTRLWEAYMACLYARRPADFVYIEDLKPGSLNHYKAIVVANQWLEMDPELKKALDDAHTAGVPIFADDTSRKELVSGYKPLGVSFNHIETQSGFNADEAYWVYPEMLLADSRILTKVLAGVPPIATVSEPEVLAASKTAGAGRYLLLVNNTHSPLPPEELYRVNLGSGTILPVKTTVRIPAGRGAVYDVLARRRVLPGADGNIEADLRTSVARLYAVLPAPIAGVTLRATRAVSAGGQLDYEISVRSASGSKIAAPLPLHLRITGANGDSLLDITATTGADGQLRGNFIIPTNAKPGGVTVEAVELASGQAAQASCAVTAAPASRWLAATAPTTSTGPLATGAATQPQTAGAEGRFGVHLRDLALIDNGNLAVANAMQWGDNLYAVDTRTGDVKWQKRVGQYWALQPQSIGSGLGVGGFDFQSASGYHFYTLGADGRATRRFACYGLPQELASVFNQGFLTRDPTLSFAAAPSGAWIASSGNLGVVAWNAEGRKLWSIDRFTSAQDATPWFIRAIDDKTLAVVDGLTIKAYEAESGKLLWAQTLAQDGKVKSIETHGGTTFVLTSVAGGTVFCLRGGKVDDSMLVTGDEFTVSADGTFIAANTANSLRLYRVGQGLMWASKAMFPWRYPRFSADNRLAVANEGGDLSIFDAGGKKVFDRDLGALAVPAFLPSGDLIAATWNGRFLRISRDYKVLWRTRVSPGAADIRPAVLTPDTTPTVRETSWLNNEASPATMPPALPGHTSMAIPQTPSGTGDIATLGDGKLVAPDKGYLPLSRVSPFRDANNLASIVFDRGRDLVRLEGLTFYEDETHPESWLRDLQLDTWDIGHHVWVPVQRLLSDSAVHAHKLTTPVEASRFRVTLPPWSYSSIRVKDITLHGTLAGLNYPPDAKAGKPVATMFDENETDLLPYQNGFNLGFAIVNRADAFSGAKYITFDPAKEGGFNVMRPIEEIDDWLYDVVENPKPGQYRYMQLAVRRDSPALQHLKIYFTHPDSGEFVPLDIKPSDKWETYRFDLWKWWSQRHKGSAGPLRINLMYITFDNGPGSLDQIVLGRTEADLDNLKPIK